MFKAFSKHRFTVDGAEIHGRVGGNGPPLLLLHGHPQSHVMWHRVADELARGFTVVALDLRGYGDSSIPASDAQHEPFSKRVMARDALAVMEQLGHARCIVGVNGRHQFRGWIGHSSPGVQESRSQRVWSVW